MAYHVWRDSLTSGLARMSVVLKSAATLRSREVRAAQMRTYEDLVRLARIHWRQGHAASSWEAARELFRLAREYQQEAAKLDGGRLPELSGDKAEKL